MKNEKGISLIALIITIIVIIILAAIVIGGVFNTPNDAKFANFCQEYDRVQTAIQMRYYDLYQKYAISASTEIPTHYEIYNEIATGTLADTLTGTSNIDEDSWVTIADSQWGTGRDKICARPSLSGAWFLRLNDGKLAYQGFEKAEQDMYYTPTAHTTGNRTARTVDYFNGLTGETVANSETQSGLQSLLTNEQSSIPGDTTEVETLTPIDTTGDVSYVGCYADIDGDGLIDGIIYVDLLAQAGTSVTWGGYTASIPSSATSGVTVDNVKDYVISQTGASNARFEKSGVDLRTYVKGNVIKLASSSTGTKDRFYVMGLDDINANQNPTWYASATGKMSPLITSNNFGEGKENTRKMIAKWNAAGTEDGYADAAKGDQDVWNYIQSGWFLPSRDEWAAFAKAFNISKTSTDVTYYGNYMLSDFYWSSSQYSAYSAWDARFSKGGMNYYSVHGTRFGRLSTTF